MVEYIPKRSEFSKVINQGGVFFDFCNTSEPTPITNRGVLEYSPVHEGVKNENQEFIATIKPNQSPLENLYVKTVGFGNKSKVIRVPKPDLTISPDYAFFDWVNFTFKKPDYPCSFEHDDDLVMSLSSKLFNIFGYGVTSKRSGGLNMYAESWNMGKVGWGFVCIGGQNDSVMVSIKAQGLYSARNDWESRLYSFINSVDSAKLTRVDLAHDSFNSTYSINDYFDMYQEDLFTCGRTRPRLELLGDWVNENIRGRTLNIGSRKSGKVLRVYEKGRQLGGGFSDEYPNWVRVELEIRADQRDLPVDMLLNPAGYLAGAYPALVFFSHKQEVILTRKKIGKINLDFSIEVTRHQFGKHIKAICELFGIDIGFQILTKGVTELPTRLDLDDYASFDKEAYLDVENIELLPLAELLGDFLPKDFQHLDYVLFKNKT